MSLIGSEDRSWRERGSRWTLDSAAETVRTPRVYHGLRARGQHQLARAPAEELAAEIDAAQRALRDWKRLHFVEQELTSVRHGNDVSWPKPPMLGGEALKTQLDARLAEARDSFRSTLLRLALGYLNKGAIRRLGMRAIGTVATVICIMQILAVWAAFQTGELQVVFSAMLIGFACLSLVIGAARFLRSQDSSPA